MDQNKILLSKELTYSTERKCLIITETYESEISENEILQRMQQIDSETLNLEKEILRLQDVINGRKLERSQLLKYITTTSTTTPTV